LTGTRENTAAWPPKIDGYNELAEHELRKLEDVDPGTTLPAAYVIARGFTAVTYAVLAVREACEGQGTDVSNTLFDIAGAGGDVAAIAVSVAGIADAVTAAPWWRRLAWRVQFAWQIRAARLAEGPEEP
jgi:hypothetical protein